MQSIFPLCFPQMLKLCSELEMVLSCHEAKRDKLRETKELCVHILVIVLFSEHVHVSLFFCSVFV